MSIPSEDGSPETHIVEALEEVGHPLGREELAERSNLEPDEFESALNYLRGQEVIQKVTQTNKYRLTYWPDQNQCAICGDDITAKEYYELKLVSEGTSTENEVAATIHEYCVQDFLDEVRTSAQ